MTVAEAAEVLGITPGAWRVRVHRGAAPQPDGRFAARTPYWRRATLDAVLDADLPRYSGALDRLER